jgi:hypothetical protein
MVTTGLLRRVALVALMGAISTICRAIAIHFVRYRKTPAEPVFMRFEVLQKERADDGI